jgi:DNA-binding CsgD family transcriptional regulator
MSDKTSGASSPAAQGGFGGGGDAGDSVGPAVASVGARPFYASTLAGFIADRTWVHLLFFSMTPFVAWGFGSDSLFANMALSLGVLGISLLALGHVFRNPGRFVLSRFGTAAAAILCCMGTCLTGLSEAGSAAGATLGFICALMTGVSSAPLYLGWVRILASAGLRRGVLLACACSAASFAVALLITVLPRAAVLVVLALCPLVSGFCLRRASMLRSSLPMHAAPVPDASSGRHSFAFERLTCGMAAFGFVAGFANVMCKEDTFGGADQTAWLLLAGFVASALLVALWLHPRSSTVITCYRLGFVFMVAGCVLVALAQSRLEVTGMLVYAGFSTIAVVAMYSFLSRREHADEAWLSFACDVMATLYLGETLGIVCCLGLDALNLQVDPTTTGVVLTLALVCVYVFLFDDKVLTTSAERGIGAAAVPRADDEPPQASNLGASQDVYTELAGRYGLSPREREVLPLLVQGRTVQRIKDELMVSSSTVNTHIRHIYAKCDVCSKQELLDLIEGLDRPRG